MAAIAVGPSLGSVLRVAFRLRFVWVRLAPYQYGLTTADAVVSLRRSSGSYQWLSIRFPGTKLKHLRHRFPRTDCNSSLLSSPAGRPATTSKRCERLLRTEQ